MNDTTDITTLTIRVAIFVVIGAIFLFTLRSKN